MSRVLGNQKRPPSTSLKINLRRQIRMNFTILKNSNPEPIIKFSSDFYDFEIEENVKMGTIVGRVGLAGFSN